MASRKQKSRAMTLWIDDDFDRDLDLRPCRCSRAYLMTEEQEKFIEKRIATAENIAKSMGVSSRKGFPVATGVIDYFPDALLAIAEVSRVGNNQHNPGTPLHWDRSKSQDEADALLRHFIDRGTLDTDGLRHSAKVAWRALALLQKEIESDAGK